MAFEEDDEVIATYIEETSERLDEIEDTLLDIHRSRGQEHEALLHGIFRCAHSIKAGANLLNLKHIEAISHSMENVLQFFRQHRHIPDEDAVTVLLSGIDGIRDLLRDVRGSKTSNISPAGVVSIVERLNMLMGQLHKP
ncbi:Hpt domain-containing protein [Candidatus Magnetobacterium casense]|uniref:Hpt domain-containing protein n=1 Tax=Candidatus Magnetobacterium casense TaxID=1455061 RepID=A0ABS6RVQ0_9BACT|nr:Hpt domain-containing protein [Candidatus Magnetobacterium casensis]MBV6340701.1 Hpt domain-containing protein [Candidatus Magnetobacterium casensis]